jgi:hypothetical protein
MDRISKLERAKKRLSPAEIRTLFADLAEPFVPGLNAVREGMAGNYGTAAVSGLLDVGGPIGKGVGLAAAPLMGAIKVFHGSPHTFDKFDMSKIGTGEGNQAYGRGLYFAENPKIALDYKKRLSKDTPGELYEVNLRWPEARETTDPLGPQHFIDWDKPLIEQQGVAKILRSIAKDKDYLPESIKKLPDYLTGKQSLELLGLSDKFSGVFLPTQLNFKGIPGIKYLDASSRTKGGTSNYVIFDDQLAEIIRRNPGLLE